MLLALPLLLAACGHSDPAPSTLSVSCDNSLLLAGATSLQAIATEHGASLSYPDPVNPGHTGSLPLQPGHPCTITTSNNKIT
ncbi:MAG: hypothetical protein INR65_08610 [Gluconacetobacter diazotrophicus]|nr:hypothetical protein [Gluconacetobacter diazotrophicus]